MSSYRRYAETAALAGTMGSVACGFALFKSGLFWTGSVSQLHAACSTAGVFVYLGGQDAATACSHASAAYAILMPLLVISILAGVGGLVAVWLSEVGAIRQARNTPRDNDNRQP